MNSYSLFLIVLFLYIGILVATGLYFSKRQHSLTDFWLAGRRAGWLSIGFSAAASWLTAGALLAVTGFFMLQGMGSIWGFVAPNVIALVIIGLLVTKIKKLPSITQPELLEMRYGGAIRLPVALIISVVMILFAVADIKGFAMVLQIFYGVTPVHAALIVGLAVAVYVTLGGLSAVIVTDVLQFSCLAVFVLVMAGIITGDAATSAGASVGSLWTTMPDGWWNPMSIGLPMVLIFILAIVPGWISEQDPWQRVWAARSNSAARNGMFFGAFLVAVVFAGCALIAIGLNRLYPDIAQMGFPMGMAKAEPALLSFIMEQSQSPLLLALCGVALATAAMSCTDTFAASGGSCLARDIYQRYLRPDATMREMRLVNRFAVLLIVAGATAGTFLIDSIIDAIHIATFIASASYFFALMGGLFWKRATGAGAAASLCIGFAVQVSFIVIDLTKTAPMAPSYLETLHPVFMGHGVILAMAASGLAFVIGSLATAPESRLRLALFFAREAEGLAETLTNTALPASPESAAAGSLRVTQFDGTSHVQLSVELLSNISWRELVAALVSFGGGWHCEGGFDGICRYGASDAGKLRRVNMSRGDSSSTVWFAAEGDSADEADLVRMVQLAHLEARERFLAVGGEQSIRTIGQLAAVSGITSGK